MPSWTAAGCARVLAQGLGPAPFTTAAAASLSIPAGSASGPRSSVRGDLVADLLEQRVAVHILLLDQPGDVPLPPGAILVRDILLGLRYPLC